MESQYEISRRIKFHNDDFTNHQIRKFGKRYVEYRKAFEHRTETNSLPSFPLYITIETSYMCNLQCITCVHGSHCKDIKKELDERFAQGLMSMEVLDAVLCQAKEYELPSIGLNWLGEPTLANDIDKRIQKCVDAGIMDVLMSSNGTLLTADLSKRIIRAGLTHMLFSLDAANKETYGNIRIKGDYEKVDKNIFDFMRIRKNETGDTHPKTRVSFVPSRLNEQEVNDFIKKYSELVDYIEIQPLVNIYNRFNDLIPFAAEKVHFACKEVFDKLTIDVNGDVHPCCSIYGRNIILGNVMKDDLKDIFLNSPILHQLRMELSKGIFKIKECRTCQDSIYKLKYNI